MYYFARSPLVCLLLCISYFVFFVMTIIAAAIMWHCAAKTYFKSSSSGEPMTYEGAYAFCLDKNKDLPLPTSFQEEQKIISSIKKSSAGSCKHVFFGWQADTGVRYENQNASSKMKFQYPSLQLDMVAAIPTVGRDWHRIKVVDNVPVINDVGKPSNTGGMPAFYLSTYGSATCLQHRYKCVYVRPARGKSNIEVEFEDAVKKDTKLYGLVLIDEKFIPTNFQLRNPTGANGITLGVRYVFNYHYGDRRLPYKSTRFTVADPEYNCMAYEVESGKIVTHPCDGQACPYCPA